ncbi:hypothetical protein ON010_g13243 [Phytophthora cinnamomi]|nr:hypothetical protein ON010_g13243 [Phytophthora cinnamomi]
MVGIPGDRPLVRVLLKELRRSQPAAAELYHPPRPPSNPGSDSNFHGERGDRTPVNQSTEARYWTTTSLVAASTIENSSSAPRHCGTRHRSSCRDSTPRLTDYKIWKSEVPLRFEPRTLGDITYGSERYDAEFVLRRVKYAEWYTARKSKTFSALALSLSVDMRSTFKIGDLRDDMEAASLLWTFITKHFEAGDGINPDYLLRDLMMRMLQPNEKVDTYAEDIE